MAGPQSLLAGIWFSLIGLILLLYVLLDGFDLGIGILTLWARDEQERSRFMTAVGYTWHANQTWLVVLGGLLFGAFPLAYGVLLSALYLPMALLLFALIFRGVSLEFRDQARHQTFWNLTFGLGSLLAALAQGFILGGILTGLKIDGEAFAGGAWDWLNPFSCLVAGGLALGYALLGATYLIIRTEAEIQARLAKASQRLAAITLLLALSASLWAIIRQPLLGAKWLTWPGCWVTSFPLLLGVGCVMLLSRALRLRRREPAPFLLSLMFFAFFFLALAGSLYPCLIPPTITAAQAAAQPLILKIMLVVLLIFLPVMLIYNGYQYWVFRGKAGEGGYGE